MGTRQCGDATTRRHPDPVGRRQGLWFHQPPGRWREAVRAHQGVRSAGRTAARGRGPELPGRPGRPGQAPRVESASAEGAGGAAASGIPGGPRVRRPLAGSRLRCVLPVVPVALADAAGRLGRLHGHEPGDVHRLCGRQARRPVAAPTGQRRHAAWPGPGLRLARRAAGPATAAAQVEQAGVPAPFLADGGGQSVRLRADLHAARGAAVDAAAGGGAMTAVVPRPLRVADVPAVLALQAQCYEARFLERAESFAAKLERADGDRTCWMAWRAGVPEPLAYLVSLTACEDSLPALDAAQLRRPAVPRFLYLHDLAVAPAGRA